MRRFLAASLSLTVILACVTPCTASAITKPVSKHDCCPPEATAPTPEAATVPRLADMPADCCLLMPAPQPVAKPPTLTMPIAARDAALAAAPAAIQTIRGIARMRSIDLHARSSPRPSIVTVLLI
jgi:hypothetical protein